MAAIKVRNLNFTYPTGDKKALDDVSFDIQPSEFVVVCGKSGCGKSTLLRQLKKNLVPYGDKSGAAYYEGTDITELDDRINASEIGFVQQNPDNQIVTDKVWHELAFGLESLGLDNQSIKRRVAEMASFFDIQTWFRKNVSELSGGQKQLLNLASIMVMQPKVLILDEPTSTLTSTEVDKLYRIVLELKDKVGALSGSVSMEGIPQPGGFSASGNASQAVEALVTLGYSASEAAAAVGKLDSALPPEELIRLALKSFGSGK